MESSLSPKLNSKVVPKELRPETHASKKRKVVEKTVVTVRIGTNNVGKLLKNEGPPSDFWSWRKYGQKPIKGSPYPRGYYRCSTSKEVEIKEEPFHYILQSPIRCAQDIVIGQEEEGGGKIEKTTSFESSTELGGFVLDEEPLINMSQFSQHQQQQQQQQQLNMCFSTQKLTEENDFFDELEELPTYSSFTRFMRSHLSDEIMIPIVPS
ncbi:hypothetical protein TIFTF001_021445 [Ficus carica]|uniref:WRKY domain-containing protein n=1 Tax=Ficus carica TaxID=3494 RepID=A0AA88DDN0_FICCA|nr:hypothetical protein TIFTF001_021445 [Ficus carica]